MKRILIAMIVCAMLAGCAAQKPTRAATEAAQATPEAVTLFDTDTCKIVLNGSETTIADKSSGNAYSYTTTRTLTTKQPTLEQLQARCIARTSASTDTMRIELAGGLIVVHDLAGNQTYYISK